MPKAIPIHKLAEPGKPLRASAPVLLVRLQEMLDWTDAIRDPKRVVELHEMRIAAKRLRYTLEIFAPTLGQRARKMLKVVEEIQERLGAIHDCDALFPVLRKTMEQEMDVEKKTVLLDGPPPFLAAEGIVALMTRMRTERARLYDEFLAYWDSLPPDAFAQDLARLVSEGDTILASDE